MQTPPWLLLHGIRFVYQALLRVRCKHTAFAAKSADSGRYCLRCGTHEFHGDAWQSVRLFAECVVMTPVALVCALVLAIWNRFEKPDRRDPH